MRIILFLILSSFFYIPVQAEILFSDNFNSYTDSADVETSGSWDLGSQVSLDSTGGSDGSKAVKIYVDKEGYSEYILSRSISGLSKSGLYVQFKAKRIDYGSCGGIKFFKIRAYTSSINYANQTFQTNYTTGEISQTDHGCGITDENDQSCGGIFGGALWGDGTIVTNGAAITIDSDWHTYEFYVELNTDDSSDGAYTVWVDGIKGREVTGVKNRSNNNSLIWTNLLLGDYARFDSCPASGNEYTLLYDDVKIADSYIGTITSSTPNLTGLKSITGGTLQ